MFIRVVKENDLPPSAKKVVLHEGKQILLCNSNGIIHAVSNICSHANETLECGRLGNGWISCPVHGARFDLATGKPKNPPAKQPITVYATRLAEGWIEVQVKNR